MMTSEGRVARTARRAGCKAKSTQICDKRDTNDRRGRVGNIDTSDRRGTDQRNVDDSDDGVITIDFTKNDKAQIADKRDALPNMKIQSRCQVRCI